MIPTPEFFKPKNKKAQAIPSKALFFGLIHVNAVGCGKRCVVLQIHPGNDPSAWGDLREPQQTLFNRD